MNHFITLFFTPSKFYFCKNKFTWMGKINFNSRVFKLLVNKWFVASILFVVWIVFFDEYSIVSHQKNKKRLFELKQQEEYYKERIQADKQKLIDLEAGEDELERFAREQYYMSKPD